MVCGRPGAFFPSPDIATSGGHSATLAHESHPAAQERVTLAAMSAPGQDAAIAAAAEAAEWHAEREGLALTFERIVVAGGAAVASFTVDTNRRLIVSLERNDADWEALTSTVLGPDHGASHSFRPSEHRAGHWTITAAGLAPASASRASIVLAGAGHVVPVIDRLYLFAVVLDREPESERLAVSFVERHSRTLVQARSVVAGNRTA